MKQLRVLYLSQYFPPEIGATQSRSYEMAKHLVEQGHHVTVITEMPNHPKGIIHPDYKGKLFLKEKIDNINIIRVWVYTSSIKTFYSRMLFYITFMVNAFFAGLFSKEKYNLVFATSPPFFVGLSGLLLSFCKRTKFIFEARDLWPESAIVLNELKNPLFIKLSEFLEKVYYKYAVAIVVVTKGIKKRLIAKKISSKKIVVIPNGSNTALFKPYSQLKRKELNLKDEFVIGYAGIFGIAQGMENLCELADQMKSERDIKFLFIGEGPKKEKIKNIKISKHLDNLIILDEIPREEIARYIACFDVAIVPLKKCLLFEGAVPTKIFDCMACEKPIIVAIKGEAKEIIESSNAGIAVSPENVEEMQNAILKLKKSEEMRKSMSQNGRQFVLKERRRCQLAHNLKELMESIVFTN